MRSLKLAAAMIAGSLGAAATPVLAQDFDASRIIATFDIEALTAVVEELGGTIETRGDNSYNIKFANGTTATANFTACNDGRCLGTNISASFGKPSDKTDAQTAELARDFNRRWSAGKSYLTDDGRPVVQAYMIVDGGITMENYRMQLSVYSQMLQKMRETLYTGG